MFEQPRKQKPLTAYGDADLARLVERYRAKGVDKFGAISLADLLMEQKRRSAVARQIDGKTIYDPLALGREILIRCHANPERKISYTDIYFSVNGQKPPRGQGWLVPIKSALFQLSGWCHEHGLPLISILVVEEGSRQLSDDAAKAFWDDWREKTPDIKAANYQAYGRQMTDAALKISPEQIG